MSPRIPFSLLMLIPFATALAAGSAPRKYTPEIHGQLRNFGKDPVTNVCLRQSGSEIRNCGYAGRDGRFFIPASGPLHSVQAKSDGDADGDLPTYWLETGNVLKPQKLWPIAPAADRSAYRACESRSSKPLVMNIPRDPTPYMMPRHEAPSK